MIRIRTTSAAPRGGRSRRWVTGLVAALVAVGVATAAPNGTVGAAFTAQDTVSDAAMVATATIADLTGGTATRDDSGTASVSWDTPAEDGDVRYAIERTIDGESTTITPDLTTGDATTGFTDDLTTPGTVAVAELHGLSAGGAHTCGIADGEVYCWGNNANGQLGDGTTTTRTSPVQVAGLTGVTAIAAGTAHTCALAEGTVSCWGYNGWGGLGDGTTQNRTTPVAVSGLSGVTAIAAGDSHTCALSGGTVSCWGYAAEGQLGNGATTPTWRTTPVQVSNLTGVTAIAAGYGHTCALADTQVHCWGSNDYGQIGDGTTANRSTPYRIASLTGITSIDGGGGHTCASTGTATYCWGWNAYGQLGDPTGTDRTTPVRVAGLSGVVALATGDVHSCALTSTTVYCWGYGATGALGNGSTANRNTPVAVSSLSGATEITTGMFHGCAVASGTAYCWGSNYAGQVGDGSTTTRSTRVAVADGELPTTVSCDVGWLATDAGRCAPGADVAVSYTVSHTVSGWGPQSPLVRSADIPPPVLTVSGTEAQRSGSEYVMRPVLTNTGSEPLTVSITTPSSYDDGTVLGVMVASAVWTVSSADGTTTLTTTLDAGASADPPRLSWNDLPAGGTTVLTVTITAAGHAPIVIEQAVTP